MIAGQAVLLQEAPQQVREVLVVRLAFHAAQLERFGAAQILLELHRLDAVTPQVEPKDVVQHRHRGFLIIVGARIATAEKMAE